MDRGAAVQTFTCVGCLDADPDFVRSAFQLDSQEKIANSIKASCPVFSTPITLTNTFEGPQADAFRLGAELASTTIANELVLIPNVPVVSAVQNTSSGARRGSLDAIHASGGGGEHIKVGVQLGGRVVSVLPTAEVEGRAMARLMVNFRWNKCTVVQCESEYCAKIQATFAAEAVKAQLQVVATHTVKDVPSLAVSLTDFLAWEETFLAQLSLNCVETRIIVLIVDTSEMASSIYDVASRNGWVDHRVTLIVSDAGAHSDKAPRGTIAVRPSSTYLTTDKVGSAAFEAYRANAALLETSAEAALGYDAFFTLASAWDAALRASASSVSGGIRSADPAEQEAAALIALQSVDFMGASGRVKFDAGLLRRFGVMEFVNFDGGAWRSIASFEVSNPSTLNSTHARS
ncbi:periplasmic binding protein-like I [Baffinella frigidus]|nr:periplasmic binding protein-like I [Cryptophyta sp. CCMP2293]